MFPTELLENLADAEVEVISFSADAGELVLKISKEIGPEFGTLTFHGVSHVNLPPRFTVFAVETHQREVGEFPGVQPEAGEWLYTFQEVWGQQFYVLAEGTTYSVHRE